jgi:hypothetical protein
MKKNKLSTQQFDAAVKALNQRCGHNHVPQYFNGFAQYESTWCTEWARLVAAQREWRRSQRGGLR